jgi:hypothetical protein
LEIEVDIATRTVGARERFYMIRPGEKFALLNDFIRRSSVFLDFPGVGLERGPFPAEADVRAMLTRAIAVRDWHNAGGGGVHPTMELAPYYRRSRGKRLVRYVASLRRLHREMPIGTIIMVPDEGYFTNVRIGEIVGDTRNIRTRTYPGEDVPARKVKWIAAKPKAYFSSALRHVLNNKNPIVHIPDSLRKRYFLLLTISIYWTINLLLGSKSQRQTSIPCQNTTFKHS